MILKTKLHGDIEYKEEDILTFNKGILGFDNLKQFIIADLEDCEPFKLFHSLENDELGIVVVSPYEFFQDYQFELTNEVVKNLKINKPDDVNVFTTVTLNSDSKKITTNLQGPIIINEVNKLGEQMIIDNAKYKVKEPLIREWLNADYN